METIPLLDQIGCVDRVIAWRERKYPYLVLKDRMTQVEADKEMALIRAVKETLRRAGPLLSEREPGALATGEAFGPAKAKQVERERIIEILRRVAPHVATAILEEIGGINAS